MEIFLLIVFLIVIWIVHDLSYPPEDYPKQPKVDPFYKIEPTVQKDHEKQIHIKNTRPAAPPKLLENKEPTTVTDPNKLVIAAEDDAFRR